LSRALLGVYSTPRNSGLPEPVREDEVLARFIFDRKHLRTLPSSAVKYHAFLPNPANNQTSVFRKVRMTDQEYKDTKLKVEGERGRKMKGTALVDVATVTESGVSVKPEESQYRWHADIEGWPLEKDEAMAIAQQIAAKAEVES